MTGTDNKGAQGGPSQKHHLSGRSLHWRRVYNKGVSHAALPFSGLNGLNSPLLPSSDYFSPPVILTGSQGGRIETSWNPVTGHPEGYTG